MHPPPHLTANALPARVAVSRPGAAAACGPLLRRWLDDNGHRDQEHGRRLLIHWARYGHPDSLELVLIKVRD